MQNRVREERVSRGLSQAEFGAALNVSRQTVISIEGGRYLPSLPLAFTIARFFDKTVDDIFSLEGEGVTVRFAQGRLRAPLLLLVVGSITAAIFWVAEGWHAGVGTEALVLVGALVYYLMSGRDDDMAALIRHETDERQASVQVRAQALVGRVLTVAIMVAYVIAIAVRAPVWPFTVLVVIAGGSFAIGLAVYR